MTAHGSESESKLSISDVSVELSPSSNRPRVLLIVCPLFPPVSAADMHRVRISLPFYTEFGWRPIVLAVDPARIGVVQDPLLLKSIPPDVPVHYTSAVPESLTRLLGFGDVGIRSVSSLRKTGTKIIREQSVDLVFFSTTVFTSMTLGRIWKRKFGIPFVLDLQDMWASDYYDSKPAAEHPPKYWMAHRVHKALESWTMKGVDGLMAVSEDYLRTLGERYPFLQELPQITLPFGVSLKDYDLAAGDATESPFFSHGDGNIHGVYVGRGGKDMAPALRILFGAFARGMREQPQLFAKVHLYFIGTSYAAAARAEKTIEPVAKEFGLEDRVHEFPLRVPYFSALRLLLASDFLVVPGSDDPEYSPSKVYPYIPAKKPMVCIIHERSNVVPRLERLRAANVISFAASGSSESKTAETVRALTHILQSIPFSPPTDWTEFESFTAKSLTRSQCRLFDLVMPGGHSIVHDRELSKNPSNG